MQSGGSYSTKYLRKPTLIELLIALGILALLVSSPLRIGKHLIGGAETSTASAELSNVQSAVDAMMLDQKLSSIPNPVTAATSDMSKFPDWENDSNGGYVLYPDSVYKNRGADNYIAGNTTGTYLCANDGTVTQFTTGYH